MVFTLVFQSIKSLTNSLIQPLFVQLLAFAFQLLPLALHLWDQGARMLDETYSPNPLKPTIYDFIVVGGGSAGAIVANRLSRKYNVLLLEAGGSPNPIQFIPLFAQNLFNYPEVDYSYRAVPQRYASQMAVNQQTLISAGKGLGGSGNLNLMIHLRGNYRDFDKWANITGDPSWSWEGVLPFFKSYEDYEIPGDDVNHAYNGDLRIEAPDYIGTAPEFIQAGLELGYPNVDLNAPHSGGFDVIRYPIRFGRRQATYKGFIEPILNRFTLTIMRYAQVHKILIKNGNIAYGVEYERHGSIQTAYASKEVILSAGTIASAKLLMLSGIGPKDHLHNLGIPVNLNLPVGERYKDHLFVFLGPFFLREPRSIHLDRDITPFEFVNWFLKGRGRLTSTTAEATAFLSSSFAQQRLEGDWPDLQIMLACVGFNAGAVSAFAHAYGLKRDVITKYFTPAIGRDACVAGVVLNRPFSTGYLRLNGRSPYDTPIINPNYLGDEDNIDFKVLTEGVQRALYIMENTTSYGIKLGVKFTDSKLPGCEHLEFRSREYFECYVRHFSVSIFHPSGTAAMGSVVDNELKMFGMKNLRVIDQSIAPVLVSANTQASTMMIGEKGSHLILSEWDGRRGHYDELKFRQYDGIQEQFDASHVVLKQRKRKRRLRFNITQI